MVLVDGEQSQAKDLESLQQFGVFRQNVWVIRERWNNEARNHHYGAYIIESELSEFLVSDDCPNFDFVYFDFCKQIPNELNERLVAVLYNLFERSRLSQNGI